MPKSSLSPFLEEVFFEFFVDVTGETLSAQDLPLVLGLPVMAPEAVALAVGLDHRRLDGHLLRLRELVHLDVPARDHDLVPLVGLRVDDGGVTGRAPFADRKSTRLNSSHLVISYAVFCLKKKKSTRQHSPPHATAYSV